MTNIILQKILSGKSRFTYRVQGDINKFKINHYDKEHYIHTNVLITINKVILITDSNIYTALIYLPMSPSWKHTSKFLRLLLEQLKTILDYK